MLVGSTEADPDEGKIERVPARPGTARPEGSSVIDVHAPAGIIKYEILDIKGWEPASCQLGNEISSEIKPEERNHNGTSK